MTEANRSHTERGFTIYDQFTDSYGHPVRVQESSNAIGAHVWIFAEPDRDYLKPEERALFAAHGIDPHELGCRLSASPHLDVEQAERVRDALDAFIFEVKDMLSGEHRASGEEDE